MFLSHVQGHPASTHGVHVLGLCSFPRLCSPHTVHLAFLSACGAFGILFLALRGKFGCSKQLALCVEPLRSDHLCLFSPQCTRVESYRPPAEGRTGQES